MDFLTLCQELRQAVGVTGTGPTAVTSQTGEMARLVRWINQAYTEICGYWTDWRFLWAEHTDTTLASTSDYTPPVDWGAWDERNVKIDGTRIDVVEYATVRDTFEASSTSGKPTLAIILPNGSLRLDPVPDATYTLTADYFKKADRMTANDDVPLIPERFHDVIVARAMILYANYEAAPEVLADGQQRYGELMAQMVASQSPNVFGANRRMEASDELVVVPQ